jgi:hypothetical protein
VEPGAEVIIPQRRTSLVTPQQVIGQVTGVASGLLTLITTILLLTRVQ